jgi:hypothetical protein
VAPTVEMLPRKDNAEDMLDVVVVKKEGEGGIVVVRRERGPLTMVAGVEETGGSTGRREVSAVSGGVIEGVWVSSGVDRLLVGFERFDRPEVREG